MKSLFVVVVAALFASGSVFAQSAPASGAAQPDTGTDVVAASPQAPLAISGGWVPPYGGQVAGKTRAEVRQELLHAQQDGKLPYLDRTVYGKT